MYVHKCLLRMFCRNIICMYAGHPRRRHFHVRFVFARRSAFSTNAFGPATLVNGKCDLQFDEKKQRKKTNFAVFANAYGGAARVHIV